MHISHNPLAGEHCVHSKLQACQAFGTQKSPTMFPLGDQVVAAAQGFLSMAQSLAGPLTSMLERHKAAIGSCRMQLFSCSLLPCANTTAESVSNRQSKLADSQSGVSVLVISSGHHRTWPLQVLEPHACVCHGCCKSPCWPQ